MILLTTFLLNVSLFRHSLLRSAFLLHTVKRCAQLGALNLFITSRTHLLGHWNNGWRLKLLSGLNYLQNLYSGVNKVVFYLLLFIVKKLTTLIAGVCDEGSEEDLGWRERWRQEYWENYTPVSCSGFRLHFSIPISVILRVSSLVFFLFSPYKFHGWSKGCLVTCQEWHRRRE